MKKKSVLIGNGYWGGVISRYIKESEAFDLIDIPKKMTDEEYERYLINVDAEVVFLCTPKRTHYSMAMLAMKYGKDVFCEKPLTGNLKHANDLFLAAKRYNKILYTDYVYTFSESIKIIKSLITGHDICNVDILFLQQGKLYNDCSVTENIGVHVFSILDSLFDFKNVKIQSLFNSYIEGYKFVSEQNMELVLDERLNINIKISINSRDKKRMLRVMTKKHIIECDFVGNVYIDNIIVNDNSISIEREICDVVEADNIKYMLSDFEGVLETRDNFINENRTKKLEKMLELVRS